MTQAFSDQMTSGTGWGYGSGDWGTIDYSGPEGQLTFDVSTRGTSTYPFGRGNPAMIAAAEFNMSSGDGLVGMLCAFGDTAPFDHFGYAGGLLGTDGSWQVVDGGSPLILAQGPAGSVPIPDRSRVDLVVECDARTTGQPVLRMWANDGALITTTPLPSSITSFDSVGVHAKVLGTGSFVVSVNQVDLYAAPSPLLGVDTIISDHPAPGDPEAVTELMRTAYAGNPHLEDLLGVLDRCAKGKTDIYEECLIGFDHVYDTGDPEYWGSDTGYLATGDMIFYEIAKGFYEVALSSHRKDSDKSRFDYELRVEFPSI